MARAMTIALIGLSGGSATAFAGEPLWVACGGALLVGATLWRMTACRHPRPLALLPPVDENGRRCAHWFCAACGARWPAEFERSTRPVSRFSGHDESKAIEASRRAAVLEMRHRELAVQRGGMDPATGKPPCRSGPVPVASREAAS